MAALAIPIVVLGSLYILSEQEEKKAVTYNTIREEINKKDAPRRYIFIQNQSNYSNGK